MIGFGLIIAIILIKYEPKYEIKVSGKKLGYVENKTAFEETLKETLIKQEEKNIDIIDMKEQPEYELKLVDRKEETKEKEIAEKLVPNAIITYKYYEIDFHQEAIDLVDTLEEAEELVNTIKQEKQEEIDLSIIEKYTQNKEEVQTKEVEIAKEDIEKKVKQKLAEEKQIENMPEVNGVKLAYLPITGTITSRYGASSRIRHSNHTGLDIAAPLGTPIKVVASGIVISANYHSSYGNIIKVDHGNGLETWYAHTSKMYVEEGQQVKAGEVIAAVGSTGNSTGPHLHLEIRLNGEHIDPQKYLYK